MKYENKEKVDKLWSLIDSHEKTRLVLETAATIEIQSTSGFNLVDLELDANKEGEALLFLSGAAKKYHKEVISLFEKEIERLKKKLEKL